MKITILLLSLSSILVASCDKKSSQSNSNNSNLPSFDNVYPISPDDGIEIPSVCEE